MQFFKSAIIATVALLFAGNAMGTALNPEAACQCPNNCDHKDGSSCAYYLGPSDQSTIVYGTCHYDAGGSLRCYG